MFWWIQFSGFLLLVSIRKNDDKIETQKLFISGGEEKGNFHFNECSWKFPSIQRSRKFFTSISFYLIAFSHSLARFSEEMFLIKHLKLYHFGKEREKDCGSTQEEKWDTFCLIMISTSSIPERIQRKKERKLFHFSSFFMILITYFSQMICV